MNLAPLSPARPMPSLPRLSLLWLGSNLFWSAVMSQVLTERVEFFAGDQKGFYVAAVGATGALLSTIVQLLVGPLSDNCTHRNGRRWVFIVWGILLAILPILFFARASSFVELMLAFALIQVLLNIATGPFQAVIPDRVPPDHHGKASGWMGVWQLLGQIVGLILPGVLLTPFLVRHITGRELNDDAALSFGVLLLCVICASALLLCLALSQRLLIEPPLPREKAVPTKQAVREAWSLELHAHPDFRQLLISRFVINIGIYSAIGFLRYYVQDVLQPTSVALETMYLALAATLGGVAGTLVAGKLADRQSKKCIIYWSCGFASLAAIGFCLTSEVWMARAIGLIFGMGYGTFVAVDWAFAANLMPQGREGKYMAIFHIAFTVPQVLALTFGGILGQTFGYRAVFWTVPIFLMAGAALISKVRERNLHLPNE